MGHHLALTLTLTLTLALTLTLTLTLTLALALALALTLTRWGTTSLGMLCFALLPPSVHPAPPSLASVFRRRGPRAVSAELRDLFAPRLVRLWLLWWCLGYAAHHVLGNYLQMQLIEHATQAQHAAYGYVEAALEVSMMLGSLGCSVAPRATLRGDAGLLSLGAALCVCCLVLTLVVPSPPGAGMLLVASLALALAPNP